MLKKGWQFPLILLMIIALSGSGLYAKNASALKIKEPLLSAFSATGAKPEELRMVAWAMVSDQGLSEAELDAYTEAIAKSLAPGLARTSLMGAGEIIYAGTPDGSDYKVIGQSGAEGAYVFISIRQQGSFEALGDLERRCRQALPGEAKLNIMLTGSLPEAGPAEIKTVFKGALKAVNGDKQEEAQGENFYSLSAYQKEMDAYILAGDKKINLQLAASIRKNQELKVYLGTPLIFTDY